MINKYKVYPITKVSFEKLYNIIKEVGSCDYDYLSNRLNCSRPALTSYLKILENSRLIRISKNPKKINENSTDDSIKILLKEKIHNAVFRKIKRLYKTYKNFSNQFAIQKATFSAWKVRKNRVPLAVLRNVCKLCSIDFSAILNNIQETDRKIIEFI